MGESERGPVSRSPETRAGGAKDESGEGGGREKDELSEERQCRCVAGSLVVGLGKLTEGEEFRSAFQPPVVVHLEHGDRGPSLRGPADDASVLELEMVRPRV